MGGGQEDGMAMIFCPHHIYCAQSKVKWGANGGGAHGANGGPMGHGPQPTPCSYATDYMPVAAQAKKQHLNNKVSHSPGW